MRALTEKKPERRIGNKDKGGAKSIISHPFFKGIEWEDVLNKRYTPPIVPKSVIDPSV